MYISGCRFSRKISKKGLVGLMGLVSVLIISVFLIFVFLLSSATVPKIIKAQEGGYCDAYCTTPTPPGCEDPTNCSVSYDSCNGGYTATPFSYLVDPEVGFYDCGCICLYSPSPPCDSYDMCEGYTTYVDYYEVDGACDIHYETCSAGNECNNSLYQCGPQGSENTLQCFYEWPKGMAPRFVWGTFPLPTNTENESVLDERGCPYSCWDGHDNDCDTDIDCDDSDCSSLVGDPCSCTTPPPTVNIRIFDPVDGGYDQGGVLYWIDNGVLFEVLGGTPPTKGVTFYYGSPYDDGPPDYCPTDYSGYCSSSNPGACDGLEGNCNGSAQCVIDSHIWACATSKDGAVAGFTSTPLEILVDTYPPIIDLSPYPEDPTSDDTPTYNGHIDDYADDPAYGSPLEGSGVIDLKYQVDSSDWTDITFTPSTDVDFTFTVSPPLSDGTHTIRVNATDHAGNSGYGSDTLTVDTTPPVVNLYPHPDPTGDTTPTYSGNANDAQSNIVSIRYQVDDGNWIDVNPFTQSQNVNFNFTISPPLSYETHTINVSATDDVGYTGYDSDNLTVSAGPGTTPPTTTTFPSCSAGFGYDDWCRSNISIFFNCADGNCNYTKVCIDASNTCDPALGSTYNTYPFTYPVSNEGEWYVRYFSVDTNGNIEFNNSLLVKIDKTNPSFDSYSVTNCDYTDTSDPNNRICYIRPGGIETFHLTSHSDSDSGIYLQHLVFTKDGCDPGACSSGDKIESKLDMFDTWTNLTNNDDYLKVGNAKVMGSPGKTFTGSWNVFSSTDAGAFRVWTKTIDYANNSAGYDDTNWWVNITPPGGNVSILINNGACGTNSEDVTLNLTFPSPGTTNCQYKNEVGPWTAPEDCMSVEPWTLTPGNGEKTVFYRANVFGNPEQTSDNITLDETPPVCTLNLPAYGGIPLLFSWDGNDTSPTCGISHYDIYLQNDSSTWVNISTIPNCTVTGKTANCSFSPGSYTFMCRVIDSVGNVGETNKSTNITKPTAFISLPEWVGPNSPEWLGSMCLGKCFNVSWFGIVPSGSGIKCYDVQWSNDSITWDYITYASGFKTRCPNPGTLTGYVPFDYHTTTVDDNVTYYFRINLTDNLGVSSNYTYANTTVDTFPPTISVINLTQPGRIDILSDASDNISGILNHSIEYWIGTSKYVKVCIPPSPYGVSQCNLSVYSSYVTYKVTAFDRAMNKNESGWFAIGVLAAFDRDSLNLVLGAETNLKVHVNNIQNISDNITLELSGYPLVKFVPIDSRYTFNCSSDNKTCTVKMDPYNQTTLLVKVSSLDVSDYRLDLDAWSNSGLNATDYVSITIGYPVSFSGLNWWAIMILIVSAVLVYYHFYFSIQQKTKR